MKVLLIDNYDSFTWNLQHLLMKNWSGAEIEVLRNDAGSLTSVPFDVLVISPGPMTPAKSGKCMEVIKKNPGKPKLGICLGMQIINEFYGGSTEASKEPVHGQAVKIRHEGSKLFKGIPKNFQAARYNSLKVTKGRKLEVTSRSVKKEIMSLEYMADRTAGVLFHPESFLTDCGDILVRNFMDYYVSEKDSDDMQMSFRGLGSA